MADSTIDAIRLIVLDVDGVLTDGRIHIDAHGVETKTFHTRDGLALRAWMKLGGEVAIITGRAGMALQHRADELGIRHVYQNVTDKRRAFGDLLRALRIVASHAAVIGDDLPDLPMMRLAGYPIAVADAVPEVRAVAEYVTGATGGCGAVRDALEHLLRSQRRWEDVTALYR